MRPAPRLLPSVTAAALAALLAAAPAHAAEDEVTLFAAASMTDAMTELATAYSAAGHPAVKLAFASSSTLAKQIENGAPADLFISADQKWMDYLSERTLIVEQTRTDIAGNALVLIVPAGSPQAAPADPATLDWRALLADDGKLAIGDPAHVPAGRYAKAALDHLKLWPTVEGHAVFAGDVRAALAFVETGEAVAGIVYSTDAAISQKVVVVGTFPPESHDPIVYPIALLAGHDRPEVRDFLGFLLSAEAAKLLGKYGFVMPARQS